MSRDNFLSKTVISDFLQNFNDTPDPDKDENQPQHQSQHQPQHQYQHQPRPQHQSLRLRVYKFYGDLKSMLNVHLIRNYLDADYADELFDDLKKIRYNTDEESMIHLYGKKIRIPREQTAYGEPNVMYHFSGISVKARDWTQDLDNESELDERVKFKLRNVSRIAGRSACSKFNYALINNYINQSNNIGYHSDDEKELGRFPVVAGVSLGQEREILFKSKLTKEVVKISLPHNSLVIMHYPTNRYWMHSIPKRAQHMGQRISITFRGVGQQ